MSGRITFYVIPHEHGWAGKIEGEAQPSFTGRNKKEIIEKTISLARDREPSSVIILDAEGKFQEERTYGDDDSLAK